MGVKAQFNSSTLKASYTAATSKAQVAVTEIPTVCGHCTGEQPAWIDVTLSLWENCSCFEVGGGGSRSSTNDSINGVYRIYHSTGCVYQTAFIDSYGGYFVYNNEPNCTGSSTEYTYTKLRVTLTLEETRIKIEVERDLAGVGYVTAWPDGVGIHYINYTGDDNCGDTSNFVSVVKAEGCTFADSTAWTKGRYGRAEVSVP